MNDLEKYSKVLADANGSMAIICKQILLSSIEDRHSMEGLFGFLEDWQVHLRKLNDLITHYEALLEKFVLEK